jgi:hypothetical protein
MFQTMNRLRTLPALALLLLAGTAVADDAHGTFQFGKAKFQIVNGMAWQGEGKDPKKPVTVVALADFKIDQPAVIAALDHANALIAQIVKAERGNFVIITLAPAGHCAIFAFLDTGKQIDLGDSFPAKTTASSATHITGDCSTAKPEKTLFGDPYEFHLVYDLPITTMPKPSTLAAGGGEPGQAFVALIGAIRANDWDAAHLHLREDEVPKTAPKPSEKKQYFEGLALNYPKTVTVTGGQIKGDQAQLQIEGAKYDGGKIKGDIAMKKVAGNWRVVDMSLYGAD